MSERTNERFINQLELIDSQINHALAELDKIAPYPENRSYHKTLISMGDKLQRLIEEVKC